MNRCPNPAYDGFFGPIKQKRNELVAAYGQDRVYRGVNLIGGRPVYPRDKRRRMMYIPANADTLDSPECTVVLEMTTSEKSWHFPSPSLYTWPPKPHHGVAVDGIRSLHISDLTPEQRTQYQSVLLKKLGSLEWELSSTRDGI